MRKRCWQNNDKGKIIDFEQGQKKFTRASSPVGQGKVQKPHPKKLVLAELVPRDTFGFESVFQIEKTTEMNHLTGTIGHPVNRVSLVAKTSVVLLFIPKRDFFLFTTYKTRKLMRTKLMNPQLGNVCHGVVVGLFFLKFGFCGLKRVCCIGTDDFRCFPQSEASIGYFSRIFKNPTNAIKQQEIWNAYKTSITKEFEQRHAVYALGGV